MELAVFYELIEIPHGTDIDVQRAPEGIASLPKSENTVITWDIGWHVGHKGSDFAPFRNSPGRGWVRDNRHGLLRLFRSMAYKGPSSPICLTRTRRITPTMTAADRAMCDET
jgi:hypothetical protein